MTIDLTDLATVKSLLTHYNVRAQKSLGQNFLIDRTVLDDILTATQLTKKDYVAEVGPGFGVLTFALAERAGRVLAIETDRQMLSILKAIGSGYPNIDILPANILRVRDQDLYARYLEWQKVIGRGASYKLVSNLPYYITSAILKQFLETNYRPDLIVVMVQREVAERIVAEPGDLSLLAISVQFFGQPSIVRVVPKTAFWPQPAVDSAILKIVPHAKIPHDIDNISQFFRMIKAGFGERRKQLHNSLAGGLGLDDKAVRNLLAGSGIDPKARAQELTLEQWTKLYHQVKELPPNR